MIGMAERHTRPVLAAAVALVAACGGTQERHFDATYPEWEERGEAAVEPADAPADRTVDPRPDGEEAGGEEPGGEAGADAEETERLDAEGRPEEARDASSDRPADEGRELDAAADEASGPCGSRTGGALVTLTVCGQLMTEWFTAGAFIDEAIAILGGAPPRIPNMLLAAGEDCDPSWSWHVDPADAEWADMTIELCDGCPGFVESDLSYWLSTVHRYCPWAADVVAVVDRR
jgi:hypothetical protein